MEKIHIRFMKEIKNIEFGELFDLILNAVAARKNDLSILTPLLDKLEPHSKELLKMNHKKLKHPLTELIQEQVTQRTQYLGGLRLTIDAKMLWHKSEVRHAAKRLLQWLDAYKDDIHAPTIHKQSRLVKDLMEERKKDAGIQQATALLDLDELLEAIVNINAKLQNNYLKRLNEKKSYDISGKIIREAAYNELRVLITVIEASYHSFESEVQKQQLRELSQSINKELKDFRTLLRSRKTKRNNRKDVYISVENLISEPLENELQENEKMDVPIVVNNQFKTEPTNGLDINKNKDSGGEGKDGKNDKDMLPPVSET